MDYCPSCESNDVVKYPGDHQQHYSRYFIEIKPQIDNFGSTLKTVEIVYFIWI